MHFGREYSVLFGDGERAHFGDGEQQRTTLPILPESSLGSRLAAELTSAGVYPLAERWLGAAAEAHMFAVGWSPRQASLPWSDVNLLIVTDVHSWVAGHPHKDHT